MLKILIVCIWFPQMRINSFYTEANPNVPLMIVFFKRLLRFSSAVWGEDLVELLNHLKIFRTFLSCSYFPSVSFTILALFL